MDELSPLLRLKVRLPQRVRINETISLPFRVINTGPTLIPELEFSVDSTLEIQSHSAFEFHLEPNEVAESSLRFAATNPGEHEVVFSFSLPGGGQLEGRLPFTVHQPAQSTQVINYTDARQIHGRVVVGTEGGRLESAGIQLGDEFKSADYVDVLLKRPARVRQIITKQLHGIFQQSPCDRLSLEIPQPNGMFNVGLLAAREISLGKRRSNDIVLRVMPPVPENEYRTVRISRQHALLRFEPEGVTWENLACRHGTVVGDTILARSESFRVFQGATISPAGQLPLCCTLFYDDQSWKESEYNRLSRQVRVEAPSGMVGSVTAVRIDRHDTLQSTETYILFQRSLILGSSRACPIHVDAPMVSLLHARLLWFGGSFWLEPLQSTQPTLVDGQPVAMNHVAQLRRHMQIQLGDTEIAVHPFRQCHVDFDP